MARRGISRTRAVAGGPRRGGCWRCGLPGHVAADCDIPVSTSLAVDGSSERLAHLPVMPREVVGALAPTPGKAFLDATFGAGGHTRLLLEQGGAAVKVVALDRDPDAVAIAKKFEAETLGRVTPVHGRFGDMVELLAGVGVPGGTLDGVLMDFGVSTMQLDASSRGFSFQSTGPLDMRMAGLSPCPRISPNICPSPSSM